MSAIAPVVTPENLEPALGRRHLAGRLFVGACLLAIGLLLLTLVLLLIDVLRGVPWLDVQFLTSYPSRRPAQAGVLPALLGSIELGLIVAAVTFPVGVSAAIYLHEYAQDSRVTRLLRTNIANLAGVPSIIYGIFGLAVFVRALALGTSILAGALTLALLILPVVIVASLEALRAVPNAQREGALALGATRWQMVRGSVLPAAAPGIVTGIILAMARAIGEAAPLILVGAVGFVTFLPTPLQAGYTVLPIMVFDWASRPQADFQNIAAAAILVILALMVILNVLALALRVRLAKNIQW